VVFTGSKSKPFLLLSITNNLVFFSEAVAQLSFTFPSPAVALKYNSSMGSGLLL